MEKIEREELKLAIKEAVDEAMDSHMKDFYVEREKHYLHHQFLTDTIDSIETFKSVCGKSIIGVAVVGIFTLIIMGIRLFIIQYKP